MRAVMKPFRVRWLGLALAGLLAACSTPQRSGPPVAPAALVTRADAAAYNAGLDIFHPVAARHGMVVSEQALASRAGLEMLRAGGNAVDAAVAVGFALAVTLPNAGNLGGGGFMMVDEAHGGRDHALDFHETAPMRAARDMYLDARDLLARRPSAAGGRAPGPARSGAFPAPDRTPWGRCVLPWADRGWPRRRNGASRRADHCA